MTAIINPHQLNAEYQALNEQFIRLTPQNKIPTLVGDKFFDILRRWGDTYYSAVWGDIAQTMSRSDKWTQIEQDTWNAGLAQAKTLFNQAAKSPGVTIALTQEISKPSGKVITADVTNIKAKVPWFWLIGTVGFIGLVVAIFSKKERSLAGTENEHFKQSRVFIDHINTILYAARHDRNAFRTCWNAVMAAEAESWWANDGTLRREIRDIKNKLIEISEERNW